MWPTVKFYYEMLDGYRFKGVMISILWAVTGLIEGGALLMLSPILSLGFKNTLPTEGYTGEILASLSTVLGSQEALFIASVVAFFVLVFFSQLGVLLAESMVAKLEGKLEANCRTKMAEATSKLSWSFYHSQRLGDLGKSLMNEGRLFAMGVQALLQAVGYLLVILALGTVAFFIAPTMMLLGSLFIGVFLYLYKVLIRKIESSSAELSALEGEVSVYGTEIFSNLKFWKSCGTTDIILKKLFHSTKLHEKNWILTNMVRYFSKFVFQTVATLFLGALLVLVFLTAKDRFTDVIIFLGIFYRIAPKIQAFQMAFLHAIEAKSFAKTWKERYDLFQKHLEPVSGSHVASFERDLVFKNVDFSYGGNEKGFQLKNVNLKINKGRFIAVVGESGSGKSTLLDLLTGLLPPTSGDILIDGMSVRELDVNGWRQKIGLVLQDTPILHATILENITWMDQKPDRDKAKRCAEQANAMEFIDKLPEGFDTVVGEKGGRLSGGQRQRVALARALYRDPWILVLDEPTSALDMNSEKQIQEALVKLKGKVTLLLVTHRLAPIKAADEIWMLKHGEFTGKADWEDLSLHSSQQRIAHA